MEHVNGLGTLKSQQGKTTRPDKRSKKTKDRPDGNSRKERDKRRWDSFRIRKKIKRKEAYSQAQKREKALNVSKGQRRRARSCSKGKLKGRAQQIARKLNQEDHKRTNNPPGLGDKKLGGGLALRGGSGGEVSGGAMLGASLICNNKEEKKARATGRKSPVVREESPSAPLEGGKTIPRFHTRRVKGGPDAKKRDGKKPLLCVDKRKTQKSKYCKMGLKKGTKLLITAS